MIKEVKSLKLEACVTLGSITNDQAKKLKKAGLDAYNHNLDTSPEFYKNIIRQFPVIIGTKLGWNIISVCSKF